VASGLIMLLKTACSLYRRSKELE